MLDVHIPEVMNTQCFDSYKMMKVFTDDEEDGITYAIQYTTKDLEIFKYYNLVHAARLQKQHSERFNGKYVTFRTLMEVVSH